MKNTQEKMNFCELFEESLKRYPTAAAIFFEERLLTFNDLDKLSSKYAYYLLKSGVKKGDIIAVSIFNCPELIAVMLAIWKIGAICLTIDPGYPSERIKAMLKISNSETLLTSKSLGSRFKFFSKNILYIDEKIANVKEVKLPEVNQNDIAYIIFTSGSTGKPKGILVEQKSLVHAAQAYKNLHNGRFRSLMAGSISFDPSILTIVFSLASGGSLHLTNNMGGVDNLNTEKIVEIMIKNSINFMLTTPSFYAKLLKKGCYFPALTNVDLCGENITRELIKKHIKIAPNSFLHNAYGPTEYAIGSSIASIYSPKTKKISNVTIGKAFSCNEIYVLDSDFKEVKTNVKGEICVAGPGLSRGYLDCPELTNKKFISVDTINNEPKRLYRTGDIGYRLSSGDIVFLGRLDFQVKINGHRVELEEVESIINSLPYIERAIVTKYTEPNSKIDKLLLFLKIGKSYEKNILKKDLTNSLPDYMRPQKIAIVKEFPMTENGKIDRKKVTSDNIQYL